jgi:LytS/YehU family sensor histidine kinase
LFITKLFRSFYKKNGLIKQVVSGGIFGGICIIGMMLPIKIIPGVIFDPRTVVLSMAGLFGGPVASVIAAALTGGYRLFLGGGGVYVGSLVVR